MSTDMLRRLTNCRVIIIILIIIIITRGRGRARRAWSDDIKEWTHLSAEEAMQLTRDRAAWRSVIHHAANVHAGE